MIRRQASAPARQRVDLGLLRGYIGVILKWKLESIWGLYRGDIGDIWSFNIEIMENGGSLGLRLEFMDFRHSLYREQL